MEKANFPLAKRSGSITKNHIPESALVITRQFVKSINHLIIALAVFSSCKENKTNNNTAMNFADTPTIPSKNRRQATTLSATSDSNISSALTHSRSDSLPTEVQSFIKRAMECNHWGGEDGYDADRRSQIEQAMKELQCSEIDRNKAALLLKYSGDSLATRAINVSDTAHF